MTVRRRLLLRIGFLVLLVAAAAPLGHSYVIAGHGDTTIREQAERPAAEQTAVAPERKAITVVTTQRRQNANRAPGSIVAIDPGGRVRYYNQTYHSYWDVDPVPYTSATVTYVAAEDADDACPPTTDCWRNVVEQVNVTTGETTRLYERVVPYRGSSRWHDVDFRNDTHLYVADIAEDRVFLVDVRTGVVEWSWEAASTFTPADGGSYPDDWTHINDVEHLPDGRLMASVRNMDQVLFIDHSAGVQANWTLGEDDAHATLYEQHNPDYLPASQGGPAVLVSDSENSRIVEYQRTNDGWHPTWRWEDERLQWPRDADRLPNGHTLVTDTHGGRVVEIAPNGSVVWTLELVAPYEAERLGTGAESAGGPSANRAGLTSRTPEVGSGGGNPVVGALKSALFTLSNLLPPLVVNGLLWVVPPWMGAREILIAGAALGIASVWVALELYWRYAVTVRSPIDGALRIPVTISRREEG